MFIKTNVKPPHGHSLAIIFTRLIEPRKFSYFEFLVFGMRLTNYYEPQTYTLSLATKWNKHMNIFYIPNVQVTLYIKARKKYK